MSCGWQLDSITTSVTRDRLGRVTQTTTETPAGAQIAATGYDALGYPKWQTVAGPTMASCTRMEHNQQGHLLRTCLLRGTANCMDQPFDACVQQATHTLRGDGQRVSTTQHGADGVEWLIEYDEAGRTKKRTRTPGPDAVEWLTTYVANAGELTITETGPADARPQLVVRVLDAKGRLKRQTIGAQVLERAFPTPNEVVETTTYRAGETLVRTINKDQRGRPTLINEQFTAPNGVVSNASQTWVWNTELQATVTHLTTMTPTGALTPINETRTEVMRVDGQGQIIQQGWTGTDVVTRRSMDAAGRVIREARTGQADRIHDWHKGQLNSTAVDGFADQLVDYTYGAGFMDITRPGPVVERHHLDKLGVRRALNVRTGAELVHTRFDVAGRRIAQTLPDAGAVMPAAAPAAWTAALAVPTWTYAHSPVGLNQVTAPDGLVWNYDHTSDGRLTTITPPENLPVRSFAYDAQGRTSDEWVKLGADTKQHTHWVWNGLEAVRTQDDVLAGVSVLRTQRHDPWGQVYDEAWSRGAAPDGDLTARSRAISRDGRLFSAKETLVGPETQSYAYTYDPAGRLIQATELGDAVGYAYAAWGTGQQVTVTSPAEVVLRQHDGLGRLLHTGAAGALVDLSYTPLGQLAQIDGLGLRETRTYGAAAPHRLTNITLTPGLNPDVAPGDSVTYDYAYDVDAVHDGSLDPTLTVTRTELGAAEVTRHWFDAQWRLAKVEYPALASGVSATRHEYTLRADGARSEEQVRLVDDGSFVEAKRFEYGGFGELTDIVTLDEFGAAGATTAVSMDGFGRVLAYETAGHVRGLTWDVEGRLLELSDTLVDRVDGDPTKDTVVSRHRYNYRDQRVRRATLAGFEKTIWDGQGVVARAWSVGDAQGVSFGAPPALGAWSGVLRAGELVLASDGVRFGHDHLGSVVLRVGVADGLVGGRPRMDVWGGVSWVGGAGGLGGLWADWALVGDGVGAGVRGGALAGSGVGVVFGAGSVCWGFGGSAEFGAVPLCIGESDGFLGSGWAEGYFRSTAWSI